MLLLRVLCEIIKILLDKGMSVASSNADDSTPLHISYRYGNIEATKTLVERGAAVDSAKIMVTFHFI